MTSAETVARLEQVLSLNPNTEELTLDAQGIENLLTLMPLLSQFTNLRRLRLARNRLRGLPEDLSALHNLELLDVSSNPIQGLGSVIRGLYGLTNLKHLYIDLPLESDEDEIIVALTSLESFNGTPLTENAVLPPPPSSVSASAPLNTSHGTGKFVTSTVSSEVTPSPPNLGTASSVSNFSKSQQANNSGVAGVKMLLSRYPVGSPVGFPSNNTHAHTYRKWSESDKAQVQRFYYAAQAIHGERIAQRSEFDEYTAHVVGHLQSVLSAEEDPFRRGVEILRAKKTIFGYCFEEIVRGAAKFNAELSKSLQVVHDTYSHLIEEADILFKDAFADRDARIASLHGDMGHAVREIETLMLQLEGGGGNRQGSVSPYLDANERQRLVEEIGWLRAENERLTVRLRQHEFARPSLSVQSVGSLQGGNGPARAHSDTMSTSQARRFGNAPDGSSLHGIQHHPTTTNSYGGMQSGPAISVGKSLTLRQLKEVIEDIYTSKSKFDIKCLETHLPRETMEQHMYTYLNQKYGLKHLILDWATAIIQGVRKYASEDNDVAVFGHILRNEIDEEFRFVQRQLKDTVHELLRVYLKGKYPLKNDEEIGKMLKRRVGSSVREEEWIDIVKYMYNAEDSVSIILRIKEVIRLYHYPRSAVRSQQRSASNYRSGSHAVDASGAPTGGTRGQRNTDSQPPNDIPYTEFLKILLDFQLEGHQRFLSSFVKAFRHVDMDRNGILNEFEFRALLNVMDPNKTEDEVTALLDMIDPHNNQLINFSECVTFLSSELVRLVQAQEGDGDCSNIASGGHAPFQRPV